MGKKINTVKATKKGWLINGTEEVRSEHENEALHEWFAEGNKAEPMYTEAEKLQSNRIRRLEEVFSSKLLGIKAIAIDEPWSSNREYIEAQTEVYKELYENAKNGVFEEATNAVIITKHEEAKSKVAGLVILANSIKSLIRNKIFEGSEDVDALLDAVEAIKLDDSFTSEDVATLKQQFGL